MRNLLEQALDKVIATDEARDNLRKKQNVKK